MLHLCCVQSVDSTYELAKDWFYFANGLRLIGNYEHALLHINIVHEIAILLHTPEIHWVCALFGKTYADMGRKDDALLYYKTGLNFLDNMRGQQSTDEIKMGVLEGSIYAYKDYVSLLLELYKERRTEQFLNDSFEEGERLKTRVFSEMLQRSKSLDTPGQETLRIQMAEIYSQLKTAGNSSEQALLFDKLDSIRVLWREEQEKHPPIPSFRSQQSVTINQVQTLLDKDSALFEYFKIPNGFALWVITKERANVFVIPGGEMLQVIEQFLTTLRQPLEGQHEIEKHIELGNQLYHSLVGPAEEQIRGKKHLIIATDGHLHYLPFETLIPGESEGIGSSLSLKNVNYLIKKFQISYVPSASVFSAIHDRTGKKKHDRGSQIPLLAFGDPIMSSMPATGDQARPLLRDTRLKPLKFSSEEIKRVAQISQVGSMPPEIYLHEKATVARFKGLDLSRYRRIHFATHAVLVDEVKWATPPAIILSPESKDGQLGMLTFSDILGMKLHAELVTLSACKTGLGKMHEGEGIVGLTRAFLYAGAASVVVSLWSVEDQSTALLMEEFYRLMARGDTKAEALRKAKLKIMRSEVKLEATDSRQSLSSPFFWAPFVLVGEWR